MLQHWLFYCIFVQCRHLEKINGRLCLCFFLAFWGIRRRHFFVVSGVIIAGLLQQNPTGHPLYSLQFFTRRFVRVYPIYWLSLGATIAVLLCSGGLYPVDFSQLTPKTLGLVTTNFLLPISWTLCLEIQFYLVAGLAMLFGRKSGAAIAVWGLVHIVAVTAAERGWEHGLYFATPITLEFLPGLLIGYLAPRQSMPFPRACIIFGCIIVAVAGYYVGPVLGTTSGLLRLAIYGPAASLIVSGALSLERAGWRPSMGLTFLGDISYSTYMWHWPTMIAVSLLFGTWLSHPAGVALYIFPQAFVSSQAGQAIDGSNARRRDGQAVCSAGRCNPGRLRQALPS